MKRIRRPKSRRSRRRFRKRIDAYWTRLIKKDKNEETRKTIRQRDRVLHRIRTVYGFIADYKKTATHNAAIRLATMPAWLYFCRPTNLAFHNLCTSLVPHAGIRSLLGLGLNFCPRPRLSSRAADVDTDRFRRDAWTRLFFAGNDPLPATRLFIRSKWSPPTDEIPPEFRIRTHQFLQRT